MDWTIDYLEDDKIVFIKTTGPITLEQNKKLCEEARSVAKKNGSHRFLVDHLGKDITLSVLELDSIPDMLKRIGIFREDRVAILYDSASPKTVLLTFLGNVLFLKSLRFRVFSDKDKAVAWLKSEQ
jgi:hypothetical protein